MRTKQTMGLAESSTVEATDGVRSRRRDEEKEDPSLLNSTLPEQFASRFEVLEVVGKGSFGKVYKVRDKKTKAIYATKHQTYNDSNIKEVDSPHCNCSSFLRSCFPCCVLCGGRLGFKLE